MTEPPRLQFPCSYPIKVVARTAPDLRRALDDVFLRLAGAAALSQVSERPSGQGNFVSFTYVIEAQSENQIGALFQELKQCPSVVMVL